MPRCLIDQSIERLREGEFAFPLGVYPVEPLSPREGYVVVFEHADGDDEDGPGLGGGLGDGLGYSAEGADGDAPLSGPPPGHGDAYQDWWPDRYVFDIQVNAERLAVLVDMAVSLMPGRVYPILDVIGVDAYREIDPYMSYELVGTERVIDGIREMRGYLYEDGMVGFGAISDEPFMYLFVDEHKLVTLAVEPDDHGRVVDMLASLGLEPLDDLRSVETVSHEHRSTLVLTSEDPHALSDEEIIEYLRDQWRLRLNVDPMTNVDDEGRPLGVTAWRCVARCQTQDLSTARYAECLLRAANLHEAEEFALDAVEALSRASSDTSGASPAPGSRSGPGSGAAPGGRSPDASGEPTRDLSGDTSGDASGPRWADVAIISCERLSPRQIADAAAEALKNGQRGRGALPGELAALDLADLRGDDRSLTGVVATQWADAPDPGKTHGGDASRPPAQEPGNGPDRRG